MVTTPDPNYDRMSELKAFDKTKSGVKGLVDAGVTEVPRIFYHPPLGDDIASPGLFEFPLIQLEGINNANPTKRFEIIQQVRDAAEKWGFFQVVNHGIAQSCLDDMIEGVREFYEQDDALKRDWYSRDQSRKVVYNTCFDMFTAPALSWRDTMFCVMAPDGPKPEDLPIPMRDIVIDYSKQIMKLGDTIFELLSEALGLKPSHLKDVGCTKGVAAMYHYSPACPQPELTMGGTNHADNDFLTVLLQDKVGGLQVLHQDLWVDVPYVHGALIVNIGDLLQLVSNDKFKSIEHRVLVNQHSPRVSVVNFYSTGLAENPLLYEPIKELLSEDNPPKFEGTTVRDYNLYHWTKGNDGSSNLDRLRL